MRYLIGVVLMVFTVALMGLGAVGDDMQQVSKAQEQQIQDQQTPGQSQDQSGNQGQNDSQEQMTGEDQLQASTEGTDSTQDSVKAAPVQTMVDTTAKEPVKPERKSNPIWTFLLVMATVIAVGLFLRYIWMRRAS